MYFIYIYTHICKCMLYIYIYIYICVCEKQPCHGKQSWRFMTASSAHVRHMIHMQSICVYICVYIHIYMYIQPCGCSATSRHASHVPHDPHWLLDGMRGCVRVCVRACVHLYVYVCVCTCVRVYVCVCIAWWMQHSG